MLGRLRCKETPPMPSELELLKHADLFHEVPEEQLAPLVEHAVWRNFDPNEVIFRKDDEGSAAYVVESGEVQIVDTSHTRGRITLTLKSEGQMFGEMALYDGQPRSADAVSTATTRCLVVKRDDFLSAIEADPALARQVISQLSKTIRLMNDMVKWIPLHPHVRVAAAVRMRMERYGQRMSDDECAVHHVPTEHGPILIDRRVSDAEIATDAQAEVELVGPLLANLQYRDIIRRDGPVIIVVRPEELEKAATPPQWLVDEPV
jgi:CRP-like cAMP-binding protein